MHLRISATPIREERCRFLVLMMCQTWSALAMLSPSWVWSIIIHTLHISNQSTNQSIRLYLYSTNTQTECNTKTPPSSTHTHTHNHPRTHTRTHTFLSYEELTKQLDVFLKIAGVQPDQQMELFRILSAILHLGNANIQASGRSSDKSYIDVKNVLLLYLHPNGFSYSLNTCLLMYLSLSASL